jgi:predicted RNA-binding protein with PUA-like domain
MAQRSYWLMKCEPEAYDIDDLARDGVTSWEGVRNFQARNLLRDEVAVGDGVLFYASNAEPSGASGVAEVARAGYPDPFAVKKGHKYFDPKSDPGQPTWFAVDIRFVERFPQLVALATLKAAPGLERMEVTRKGSRLSVQRVTAEEFEIVCQLGRGGGVAGAAGPAPAMPAKAGAPAAEAAEMPRAAAPRRAAAKGVAAPPAKGKRPAAAKPAAPPSRAAGRRAAAKPLAAKAASTRPAKAATPAAPAKLRATKPRGQAGGGPARRPRGPARRGAS